MSYLQCWVMANGASGESFSRKPRVVAVARDTKDIVDDIYLDLGHTRSADSVSGKDGHRWIQTNSSQAFFADCLGTYSIDEYFGPQNGRVSNVWRLMEGFCWVAGFVGREKERGSDTAGRNSLIGQIISSLAVAWAAENGETSCKPFSLSSNRKKG